MSSVFELCERTLGMLGGHRLTMTAGERAMLEALDCEGLAAAKAQNEAMVCARHFGFVRDGLLESYAWVFAVKTAAAAELAEEDARGRVYALPSDCLRVIEVISWDGRSLPEYWAEGGRLYCGRGGIRLRYLRKDIAVSGWPPAFCDAFCYRLAAETGFEITGAQGAGEYAARMASGAIQEAYRLGVIDERPASGMELYAWDRYNRNAGGDEA